MNNVFIAFAISMTLTGTTDYLRTYKQLHYSALAYILTIHAD